MVSVLPDEHAAVDVADPSLPPVGDGENSRCEFFHGVCLDSPTHMISFLGGERSTYCRRHYILTMAEYLNTQLDCGHVMAGHIEAYGLIDSPVVRVVTHS